MTDPVPADSALQETPGFFWDEVTARRGRRVRMLRSRPVAIAGFSGTFRGVGFNTIFRPMNLAASPPDPTDLPNSAQGPTDNLLELNLTVETLSFLPLIGNIPNRGTVDRDIFLNAVPYLQSINDVTVPEVFDFDVTDPPGPENLPGIHLEPGVWLAIPDPDAADDAGGPDDQSAAPTYARLASIPHGTTVEAQGNSFSIAGKPTFPSVDITPFPIGQPGNRLNGVFPSQDVTNPATFRLPQDLKQFVANKKITDAMLKNPNAVLQDRVDAQTITATTGIVVSSTPGDPLLTDPNSSQVFGAALEGKVADVGGGLADIAFLLGKKNANNPNADAAQMTSTFWIETVEEQLTLPAMAAGMSVLVPGSKAAGNPVAKFQVSATTEVAAGTEVTVSYTQIQYTQTVMLNFATLSWPHVSVATLIPKDAIPVSV